MTTVDLAETRRVLEAERDTLRAEIDVITATPRDPMAAVSFGKRIGEGTSQAVERIARLEEIASGRPAS